MKINRKRQEGQGLVEYALILVLVAIVVIGILSILGPQVAQVYARVICALDTSGDLASFTASNDGSTLTVTAQVRRETTITIAGDVNGGGFCSGPSCTFTFANPPNNGSLTIEATNGDCYGAYSW